MEANELQNIKIELIQWLTVLDDETVIKKLLDLKNHQLKDVWNKLSDAEIKSIKKGLDDAKKGKLLSHSEARKIYEKYL